MKNRGWAALAAAMVVMGSAAAAQDAPAEDTSRWRYLTKAGEMPIIVNDMIDGQRDIRKFTAHTILVQPHASGVDGITTEYEVNCRAETITDLGSIGYAGAEEKGRIPPQNDGNPNQYQAGTLFGDLIQYGCRRRVASGDRRVVTGKAAAVEYAKERAERR